MSITPEKLKQIDALKTSIDKKYGLDSIQILGQGNEVSNMVRVSSGIASLDAVIGGGWPRGRIIEIYGPESSGKTTATLEAIAEAQKLDHICAIVDVEHALDLTYASNLGVNVEDLILSQPDTAEEALDIVEMLVSSGVVQLIVVDSVAALVPKKELEGEMGDITIGLQARLMGQALRKLVGQVHRNNVTLFFINQLRMKIGVMFGNPETTSGGNALKFYASIRLDIRKTGQVKDGEESVANEVRVKVVKNKTAPPYKECNLILRYGTGVDKDMDLLRMCVENKIVDKSGAWYSYEGVRLGQGEANSAKALAEYPEEELTKIKNKLKPTTMKNLVDLEKV
jgi:recombination protein RecA